MKNEFDDRFEKSGTINLTPLNIKEKPQRQTAVAIKDKRQEEKPPEIVAAGRGKIAEQIMQIAFENNIKVREDSLLVEMLANIELDSPIPSEAFGAVAEILSYVYQANGKPDPFDSIIDNDY